MFCGGRLRLGRTAVEAEVGVGYEERPLLSLVVMRVATSMDGGVLNDGGAGSGGCRSCRSDMACREEGMTCFGRLRMMRIIIILMVINNNRRD